MTRLPHRLGAIAGLLALTLALLAPASASAHAVLEATVPERGAELDAPPSAVEFSFNEPVEAAFGAVRVYDADGERVDEEELLRPGGRSDAVGVALPYDLPDGTYTAVFRVVSADAHPVSGGFTFSVGEAGGPALGVADLVQEADPAPTTDVAFDLIRALGYLAMALVVGIPAYALLAFAPAVRSLARGRSRREGAAAAFAARKRRWVASAALLGVAASVAAIVLQVSIAGGTSVLSALEPERLSDGLETRFGTVVGLRAAAFALIGAVVALPVPRRVRGALLAGAGAYLIVSPALSGHPSSQDPAWLLTLSSALHVGAASLWVGGIAATLGVLPAATRQLEPEERGDLLTGVLHRFSNVALASVAAILVSGIVQSVLLLESVSELFETGYGRAILVKAVLLAALVALGAVNRRLLLPALERRARSSRSPGHAGMRLRRVLLAESGLLAGVLVAAAVLSSSQLPSSIAAGPQSGSLTMGPALVEWTLDPGSVGENEMHVYLFDAETGAPYERLRGFEVSLSLPDREIGPLEAEAEPTGPGHYTVPAAPFGVAGDWEVEVSGRTGPFDAVAGTFEVEID